MEKNESELNQTGEVAPEVDSAEGEERKAQRAFRKMSAQNPESFTEFTAMMGFGGNPLHHKMNETHITKVLDLAIQHDTNEFELKKKQQDIDANSGRMDRNFKLGVFAIFVLLLVFILWVYRNQPTVLIPILSGVGGITAGFLGGLGFSKAKQSESR